MPSVLVLLRANASNVYFAVGIAWLAVAVLASSVLVAWPVAACLASGVALRMRPGKRLTWAWTVSSAVLGLVLSAYQVYAWVPFLGGTFSTLAATALVGFSLFAVVHLFLVYAGLRPAAPTAVSS